MNGRKWDEIGWSPDGVRYRAHYAADKLDFCIYTCVISSISEEISDLSCTVKNSLIVGLLRTLEDIRHIVSPLFVPKLYMAQLFVLQTKTTFLNSLILTSWTFSAVTQLLFDASFLYSYPPMKLGIFMQCRIKTYLLATFAHFSFLWKAWI